MDGRQAGERSSGEGLRGDVPVGDGPVLLTGASGLLGAWMLRTVPAGCSVVALASQRQVAGVPGVRADLRDADAVLDAVRRVAPRLVVHAAYAMDRGSIVDATRHVVSAASEVGAEVVLTSTDAVFSGDGVPRDEAATPDPIADYGRWKAEAEQSVLASPAGCVVRLPILLSVDPEDHLIRQIRAAAAAGQVSSWFVDEIRRPAMASEVAAALWRIALLAPPDRGGVWHLAGAERLSRSELAQRIVGRVGLPVDAIEGVPTPSGLVRPRDLELTDDRARSSIAWQPVPVLA